MKSGWKENLIHLEPARCEFSPIPLKILREDDSFFLATGAAVIICILTAAKSNTCFTQRASTHISLVILQERGEFFRLQGALRHPRASRVPRGTCNFRDGRTGENLIFETTGFHVDRHVA